MLCYNDNMSDNRKLSNDLTSITGDCSSGMTPFMNLFWQQQKKHCNWYPISFHGRTLLSGDDFIRLQCASILSATLIASNVAAFHNNPPKSLQISVESEHNISHKTFLGPFLSIHQTVF